MREKLIGRVLIEDIDSKSGKTSRWYEGSNHIFRKSFLCENWSHALSFSGAPNFIITDDFTAPDDDFPYLKGNVELWGTIGMRTDHNRRGEFISDQSFIGVDASIPPDLITGEVSKFPKGKGMAWRYVYEFSESQIRNTTLGCVGISEQYDGRTDRLGGFLRPQMKISPILFENIPLHFRRGGVLRNNVLYTLNAPILVNHIPFWTSSIFCFTKYDIEYGCLENIPLPSILGDGFIDAVTFGIDFTSDKVYLAIMRNSRFFIYEFEDCSLTCHVKTIERPYLDVGRHHTSANRLPFNYGGTGFVVYRDMIYQYDSRGLSGTSLVGEGNWELITPISYCPLNRGWLGSERSVRPFLTVKNGCFYALGTTFTHHVPSLPFSPIFQLDSCKQLAYTRQHFYPFFVYEDMDNQFAFAETIGYYFDDPGGAAPVQNIISPNWTIPTFLVRTVSNAAMCAFAIPEHMRQALPGAGRRFTYHIDVLF